MPAVRGHKLFGERVGVLHPLLKAVLRYSSDLRRLHVSQDADAAKSKAIGKGRRPAKRKARTRKLTTKELDALAIFTRVQTYTATAEELGISRQRAAQLVKRAQEKTISINAEATEIQAERSSGKSVKLGLNFPPTASVYRREVWERIQEEKKKLAADGVSSIAPKLRKQVRGGSD